MGQPAVIEKAQNGHLQIVSSLADLLRYNTYAMLGENVIVYENGEGGYVIFTIDPEGNYTKEDYMKLPEGAPFELLNGKLIFMASPKTLHQRISMILSSALFFYVTKNNLGQVFSAPCDIHFDKNNIVQPNIVFISKEREDIIKDWIFGAPELAIEIFSPSTKRTDKKEKFEIYQKFGVREYWMVDTDAKTIEVQVLKEKKFVLKKKYGEGDVLKSNVVVGFDMALDNVFES